MNHQIERFFLLMLVLWCSTIGFSTTCYTQNSISDTTSAHFYSELGRSLLSQEKYTESLGAYRKCYALLQEDSVKNDSLLYFPLRQIGLIFFNTGPRSESVFYLEKALLHGTRHYGAESRESAWVLNLLGEVHCYLGNFELSQSLLEKSLAIRQKIYPPFHVDISKSYYRLGMLWKALHKYDASLLCYEKALEIHLKNQEKYPDYVAGSYSEIGEVYLEMGNYKQALDYFEKSNAIMVQLGATEDRDYAYVTNEFGRVYSALKEYEQSAMWFEKTLEILHKVFQKENSEIATVLVQLGKVQTASGDFAKAEKTIEHAKQIWLSLPQQENEKVYLAENGLAIMYRERYIQSHVDWELQQSRAHFKSAAQLVDRLIRSENATVIRKKWLADAKGIFEQAIITEYLLYQQKDTQALENAWTYSETMHGFDLFVGAQESNARRSSDIPPEFLEQEQTLRSRLTAIQNEHIQLVDIQGLTINDAQVMDNNARYFAQKVLYENLLLNFEKKYPRYYAQKYQFSTIPLNETQELLTSGQTLLEYFTGDSAVFVFVIRQHDARMITIPADHSWTDWVKKLRRNLTGYYHPERNQQIDYYQSVLGYAEAAQVLFRQFVLPIVPFLGEEVLIVPDGELNYVPFEVLLSGAPRELSNFSTYPFLLKNKSISYAWSASMFRALKDQAGLKKTSGDLLGVAPFTFKQNNTIRAGINDDIVQRKVFVPLPFTEAEVQCARKRIGGNSTLLNGSTATLEQFKALAPQYRILHLATHAKANEDTGEYSFLAFYSPTDSVQRNLLYVSDLYDIQLNASLVLLSACETGMGELHKGEGVVSLARAFTFAGAQSVVTSLWSVSDQSTQYLMDYFYNGIHQQKNVSTALTDAKRQYVKEHPGIASHPFFWAGFVGGGNCW